MKKYFACLVLIAPLTVCMDNQNTTNNEQQKNPSTESIKEQKATPKDESRQQAYRPDLSYRLDNGMTIEEAYQAGYEIRWWSLGAAMASGHKQ